MDHEEEMNGMATPRISSLVDYLESSAQRFPDRTALVDPAGWSVTYREVDEQADRIAGFLVDAGVAPGDRVGVIVPKGAAAVVAFFGIMKVRAAYVPADYTAPAARNRSILSDCAVRVAVLSPEGAAILEGWPEQTPQPSAVIFVGSEGAPAVPRGVRGVAWEDVLRHPPARIGGRRDDDLAYILYTSGSTGVPKGVMLTHENALSFVDWCSDVFKPSEQDRFSSHAPFHFDLSVLDLYLPLKHGAAVHIISEELGKSPKDLAEFISQRRLTVWYSTPSILGLLAQFGDLGTRDCSALRIVLFAGEVFPVKHLRHITRLWSWAEYYNLYGPTETNVCTFARIPLPVPEDRTAPYPIGWACSHCMPLVLDADQSEVNPGDEGLLYIAGPSVFQGYWNRPEQSASVFLERDGRRWYNTGDVVRLDSRDGYIYAGRRDRMVKRRGYRIELGEIERGLYQHPSIREAAVVSVPDESSGARIVAWLSAREGQRPSIIEMKTFCARQLPSYMSPDVFRFMDALPRTSTDKVDYQGLTRLASAPAAASSAPR
jgi:amino acid adenylation domain-containing protein